MEDLQTFVDKEGNILDEKGRVLNPRLGEIKFEDGQNHLHYLMERGLAGRVLNWFFGPIKIRGKVIATGYDRRTAEELERNGYIQGGVTYFVVLWTYDKKRKRNYSVAFDGFSKVPLVGSHQTYEVSRQICSFRKILP